MSQDNPLTAGADNQQVAALLEDALFHVKPETVGQDHMVDRAIIC